MADLSALIEHVAALTGPSREVDGEVADHFKAYAFDWSNPYFTLSLDAAVALVERVLPGCDWEAEKWMGKGIAGINSGDNELAATPAIALVLATLRALQAKGGE